MAVERARKAVRHRPHHHRDGGDLAREFLPDLLRGGDRDGVDAGPCGITRKLLLLRIPCKARRQTRHLRDRAAAHGSDVEVGKGRRDADLHLVRLKDGGVDAVQPGVRGRLVLAEHHEAGVRRHPPAVLRRHLHHVAPRRELGRVRHGEDVLAVVVHELERGAGRQLARRDRGVGLGIGRDGNGERPRLLRVPGTGIGSGAGGGVAHGQRDEVRVLLHELGGVRHVPRRHLDLRGLVLAP